MKSFSLLISILFTLCLCPCHAQDADTTHEYNLLLNARGNDVTAICIMSAEADGTVVGTVVNEFGVKILDFRYANGKAKVMNVFKPLNKWYIRKVLNKDFTFIISNINATSNVTDRKRRLLLQPNGDIFVSNDKYNITYTFTKLFEVSENRNT